MFYTSKTWRAFLLEKHRIWSGYIRYSKRKRHSKVNLIIQARRHAIAMKNKQRDKSPRAKAFRYPPTDFQNTQWGKLIARLSQLNDGRGPCITQREGKLFRRRFRVPWQIFCELVVKCKEFNLFGIRSNDNVDL